MRKLVFVRTKYFRDFLSTGAFDAIDDDDTVFVGEGAPKPPLSDHPRFAGTVDPSSRERVKAYSEIRETLLTSYRFRSRTARVKLRQRPPLERLRATAKAAPGRRQRRIAKLMRDTGVREDIVEVIREVAPDLIITPSSGVDSTEVDVFRAGRAAGVPSLGLMYNWDNLSSKSAFAEAPDYLGVIGHQSAEHAVKIHGIERERVGVLGSPYIDSHFHHPPFSTASPFPFRYVLFAGCYQPFDELAALRHLDAAITREALGMTVVYLPHPRRLPRLRPDFVDEQQFENVVVEPRVRDGYRAGWSDSEQRAPLKIQPLPMSAYPALLENAEFVVCPLSTIMLEAAIFGRRVLTIAYHDGIHKTSPGVAIDYLHFEGVDAVEQFEICRREEDLQSMFTQTASTPDPGVQPSKEQMDYWIYHDERPFSARLAAFLHDVGEREGSPPRLLADL